MHDMHLIRIAEEYFPHHPPRWRRVNATALLVLAAAFGWFVGILTAVIAWGVL